MSGDIAGRPNPGVAGAQMLIDIYGSTIRKPDSGLVQSHSRSVGLPPRRDEDLIDGDLLAAVAVIDTDRPTITGAADGIDLHAGQHRGSFLLEDRAHHRRYLQLLERCDARHCLEERHLAAELQEELSQLKPDCVGSNYCQLLWRCPDLEGGGTGQITGFA